MRLRRGVFVVLVSLICAAASATAAEIATTSGGKALDANYIGTHRLRVNRIPGISRNSIRTRISNSGSVGVNGMSAPLAL